MCSNEPSPQNVSQVLPDTCPTSASSQVSQPLNQSLGAQPWGYIFPNKPNLKWIPLFEKEYLVGRAPKCDLILGEEIEASLRCQFSKEHFRLRRAPLSANSDLTVVHLDDLSFNGTYVNGKRLGKGRSTVLRNNDRISMALASFDAFIYMDREPDLELRKHPSDVHAKYAISRKLGSGAYGEVRLVFNKETGEAFAMKIIQKNKFLHPGKPALNHPTRIQREISILKRLQHSFVIKFHDVLDHPDVVFVVMELVRGGELFERVTKRALKESVAKYFFYQLALAIKYLHSKGIIHRDIKLENILLTADPEFPMIKLADFGLSKFIDSESMLKTFCGTPMYIAPEVLKSEGRSGTYDTQADVWSMGIVLFMCLSGTAPFSQGDKNRPLSKQIQDGYFSFPRKEWRPVTHNAKHLVKRMLVTNPKLRITIDQILEHPWLRDVGLKTKVHGLLRDESYRFFNGKENLIDEVIEESNENESQEEVNKVAVEETTEHLERPLIVLKENPSAKRHLDSDGPCPKRVRLDELDTSSIHSNSELYHSALSFI